MMTEDEIRTTVNSTIRDVLDLDDSVHIDETTTAPDVEGWDSLQHVRIMLSLERKLKFEWSEDEIASLKSVGDIYKTAAQKLAA